LEGIKFKNPGWCRGPLLALHSDDQAYGNGHINQLISQNGKSVVCAQ